MDGHKIHLAGYYNGKASVYEVPDYPYFLESYHYINNQRFVDMIRADDRKVFLDSGAFSAFTKGVEIDLQEYANYIKSNADIIDVASVLDGIGDPDLTLENQKRLEDMGAEVLPCFHYGEDPSFLEHYIENYEYITLGGMVPISTGPLEQWLDHVWGDFLTDDQGMPRLKVHGFGLTTLNLMLKYPWYSVDSTSWVLTGRFGSIYWPTPNRPANKLVISDQSPQTKNQGKHYDTLSPIEREVIDAEIIRCGYDPEKLRNWYPARDLWNIDYFHKLCDRPLEPFFKQTMGLFE